MQVETFLKKFLELRDKCPRASSGSQDNENCLYTETLGYSKNCYYVFTGGFSEDCYYDEFIIKCKNCVDCLKIEQSELCYECTECYQCYNCSFLLNCSSTRDSQYSYDLRGCADCFLSSNQQHKSYMFKNKQYTKEEYEALVNEYKKTHSTSQLYDEFMRVCATAVRLNLNVINSENCFGDHISDSKNVYCGFDVVKAQDYLYALESGYGSDSCDILVSGQAQLLYECVDVVKNAYNCNFCHIAISCVNCEFCQVCYNLTDCFGCFYLKGKKFHILNQPYEPEEYKKEVAGLRKALMEAGKYHLGMMVQA